MNVIGPFKFVGAKFYWTNYYFPISERSLTHHPSDSWFLLQAVESWNSNTKKTLRRPSNSCISSKFPAGKSWSGKREKQTDGGSREKQSPSRKVRWLTHWFSCDTLLKPFPFPFHSHLSTCCHVMFCPVFKLSCLPNTKICFSVLAFFSPFCFALWFCVSPSLLPIHSRFPFFQCHSILSVPLTSFCSASFFLFRFLPVPLPFCPA